ncbi:MAG: type II toxin-antitoxin system HicB family antitoxin [Armatimonadetes bacterium]|nr:type II toxin-antitoxin system HicB family antitoxin [Armatimonadota bacterium]
MSSLRRLTVLIEREDAAYVALCPEVDVVSQGQTIEEARANLVEALTLFFEHADPSEITARLHNEVLVTSVEVPVPIG